MKFLISAVLFSVTILLVACQPPSNSSSVNNRPKVFRKPGTLVCQPEAKLLAAGVAGGEVVKKGDSDDVASVGLITGDGICTATVIGDDVLLTAAHCVLEDPSQIEAIFHPSISCESGFDGKAHTIVARKVVAHSGYNTAIDVKDRVDDIGLVFLSQKIPAQYPRFRIADPSTFGSIESIQLFGYRNIGYKKGGRGILRTVNLSSEVLKVHLNSRLIIINQKQGEGICLGDSGGSSLIKVGGERFGIGVSSFVAGDKAALDKDPDLCRHTGAQTYAPAYRDWIEAETNKNSANNSEP